jgi:hypothetical protein
MKIVVFADQQPTASDNALIAKFESIGLRVLVDSLHKHEINWIIHNYGSCPHRVYFADQSELYDGIVKELDQKAPFNFIAYFDEQEVLNNADWVYIRLYLKAVLYNEKMPRLTRRLTAMLNDTHTENVEAVCKVDEHNDAEPCYTFKKAIFEDRNIALCEIVKPIVVRYQDKKEEKSLVEQSVPYTIVVRNFATRGFYPVFWSLFVCESWGKDNRDIQFLKALWGDLKMEGVFDMDQIIDAGIKECNWGNGEGASAGPEVYRKSLSETLDTLLVKERGYVVE